MRVRTLARSITYTFGFLAFLYFLMALAGAEPARAQLGFDRPGGDYASAAVPSGDPAVCAARCERDKSCRSWSFAFPSASGEQAMCWLKREVVPRAKAAAVLKKAQELDDTEHRMYPFIEKFKSIKEAVKQFGRI